jgi:rhodanese-related sulfurtransferase
LLSVGGEQEPRYAFTGDTLFIGGIGRPDLLDVPPAQLAAQSFDSIQRLKSLPDATLVLPAHGAGSLCGAHLSPATTSTIGDEKRTNEYLRIAGRSSFIAKVLSHQPVAPQYFGFNVELNRKGPPLVDRGQAMPPKLDLAAVKAAPDAWLVDLRHQHAYADAHLRGAVNVALRGRLDTWTGIVVPPDAELWVVGSEKEVAEGVFRLRRIGYDRIAGWIEDDVAAWRAAGLDVRSSKLVAPKDLYALMQKGEEPIVIDVRTADEHADLRLGDIGNIPVTESLRFGKTLPKDVPVVMLCNSAYRSSMAVGLAERQGFVDVASLDGGMDAWLAEGLPAIGRMVDAAAVRLPATVTAKDLAADTNGMALFDLRADWEWNDWRVPGSQRVGLDELVGAVAELPSDRRIVLLSKDGESAFAAAGALLKQYPDRAIVVLRGGVAAYYREVVLRSASAAPSVPSPIPAAPTSGKPVVKKRNVGC